MNEALTNAFELTYARFHLIFTIPALIIAGIAASARGGFTYIRLATLTILLAVVYAAATPWDAYLVRNGVWGYSSKPVLGTFLDVPYEEYFFFGIQTLITSLVYFAITTPTRIESIQEDEVAKFSKEKSGFRMGKGLSNKIGLAAIVGIMGALLNTSNPSYFYLKTIVVYYLAFISIQVILGMRQILMSKALGRLALATAIPTLFYWITDAIAINAGTWSITERTSTGLKLFNTLPIEEAIFFAITNMVIVQGLYLVELNYDLLFGHLNTKIKLAANPELTSTRKVTVIGAGIGGLAIAARLAKLGFNVTVYEKKGHVGMSRVLATVSQQVN